MQACGMSFSQFRLVPMGSYPRIADKRGTLELFGPVSRVLCAGYDRAMVAFLACLRVSRTKQCCIGGNDGLGR